MADVQNEDAPAVRGIEGQIGPLADTGTSVLTRVGGLPGERLPAGPLEIADIKFADLARLAAVARYSPTFQLSLVGQSTMAAIAAQIGSRALVQNAVRAASVFAVRNEQANRKALVGADLNRLIGANVSGHWARQHREMLASLSTQIVQQHRTLLADLALTRQVAGFGSVAKLMKDLNLDGMSSMSSVRAANLAVASISMRTAEHLAVTGATARLVQGLQLADGLGAVARLSAAVPPELGSRNLSFGVSSYGAAQSILADFARDNDQVLLRGRSLPAAVRLNTYLDTLGTRPLQRRADLAGLASDAAAGLVLGEGVAAPGLSDEAREFLAGTAETGLIEPWREEFDDTRTELFAALESLSPHLADLLRGAWFNIKANGPAAASSAASCLVEVLDQTLHALVDEVALPGWLVQTDRNGPQYIDAPSGRPTRRARLAYALRHRSQRDARLVSALETSLAAALPPMKESLERAKHGRFDIGVQAVRCHAVTVESLLINLLLGNN